MADFGWLVGAIPAASGLVALVRELFEPSVMRSAKRHAELLKATPEGVDASRLRVTLEAELVAIADRADRRLRRRVDWGTVATIVLVTLVVAGPAWGLWVLDALALPWVGWSLSRVLAVLLATVGGIFVLVGGGSSLFTTTATEDQGPPSEVSVGPPEDDPSEGRVEGAAAPAGMARIDRAAPGRTPRNHDDATLPNARVDPQPPT